MKHSRYHMFLAASAVAAGLFLTPAARAQTRFIQAELMNTIKAKRAHVGDPVKARTVHQTMLSNGMTIPGGTEILGEVREVDAKSLAISFDRVDLDGKPAPLSLSIRAAMMPGAETQTNEKARNGSVMGMPHVTLQVDKGPQHASKFETTGKELQLKQGLQLMLGLPEPE